MKQLEDDDFIRKSFYPMLFAALFLIFLKIFGSFNKMITEPIYSQEIQKFKGNVEVVKPKNQDFLSLNIRTPDNRLVNCLLYSNRVSVNSNLNSIFFEFEANERIYPTFEDKLTRLSNNMSWNSQDLLLRGFTLGGSVVYSPTRLYCGDSLKLKN